MILPYRARQHIKRAFITLGILLAVAAVVFGCWMLWLHRYVIYSDEGARLDFSLGDIQGIKAGDDSSGETISIYYNEGDDAVDTNKELETFSGFYITTDDLKKDIPGLIDQIRALPEDAPVMVDVKSGTGLFYYSSSVSENRHKGIDTAAMDGLIAELKQSGRYAIARVPALRDYYYGLHHVPDGLPTGKGYLWQDDQRCYWLNPGSQGTLTYLVEIVNELKNLGFDEVVFYEFYIPEDDGIVFKADRTETLTKAAQTLVTTCATDSFALSFYMDKTFTVPSGRCRVYLNQADAAMAASAAAATGVTENQRIVFFTDNNDTRFDEYCVLRPIDTAH